MAKRGRRVPTALLSAETRICLRSPDSRGRWAPPLSGSIMPDSIPLLLPPARNHSLSSPLSTKVASANKQSRKGCSRRGGEQIPGRLRRRNSENQTKTAAASYQQFQHHHSGRNVLGVQGRNARRRQDQKPEALKYIVAVWILEIRFLCTLKFEQQASSEFSEPRLLFPSGVDRTLDPVRSVKSELD